MSNIDGLRGLRIFADIPGYPCPTVVTGTLNRPDVIIVCQEKIVIVLELACGFITNVKENCARKIGKYNSTIVDLKKQFERVTFVNLSMSALGLICRDDNGNGIIQALKSIGLANGNDPGLADCFYTLLILRQGFCSDRPSFLALQESRKQ